jgi:hypothetical protein
MFEAGEGPLTPQGVDPHPPRSLALAATNHLPKNSPKQVVGDVAVPDPPRGARSIQRMAKKSRVVKFSPPSLQPVARPLSSLSQSLGFARSAMKFQNSNA